MEELRFPAANSDADPKLLVKIGLNGQPIFVGGACRKCELKQQFETLKEAMK